MILCYVILYSGTSPFRYKIWPWVKARQSWILAWEMAIHASVRRESSSKKEALCWSRGLKGQVSQKIFRMFISVVR